jgi:hypothetical protein
MADSLTVFAAKSHASSCLIAILADAPKLDLKDVMRGGFRVVVLETSPIE